MHKNLIIWIIIGVLALVLVYFLFKGKSSSTTDAAGQYGAVPDQGSGGFADLIGSMATGTYDKGACKDQCSQLCSPVPILKGKAQDQGWIRGRDACKDQCNSDCAGGKNVGSLYPNAWKA